MKRQKYGYIYRTHLFGNPTVRVTGADNVKHILLGEHRLVSAQWPASVRTILGSDTLSNVHGVQHKTKKKVRITLLLDTEWDENPHCDDRLKKTCTKYIFERCTFERKIMR